MKTAKLKNNEFASSGYVKEEKSQGQVPRTSSLPPPPKPIKTNKSKK